MAWCISSNNCLSLSWLSFELPQWLPNAGRRTVPWLLCLGLSLRCDVANFAADFPDAVDGRCFFRFKSLCWEVEQPAFILLLLLFLVPLGLDLESAALAALLDNLFIALVEDALWLLGAVLEEDAWLSVELARLEFAPVATAVAAWVYAAILSRIDVNLMGPSSGPLAAILPYTVQGDSDIDTGTMLLSNSTTDVTDVLQLQSSQPTC